MTRQDLVNKSIDKLNTVKEALELIEILEYDECIAVLTGTKNLPSEIHSALMRRGKEANGGKTTLALAMAGMQNLGCTDLMNPYQNVRVGIDFLSYLLKKYGTIQDTLAAYNYGEKGAREYLWSNGVYVYSYNTAIMQRMKEIEEVVGK